ncbi:MFS transporter [Kocuria atrinae]|uniref:MFS transporter n=1 Tax=Kocuria atrinae TaxID=592377 RepID=A0ABN2XL08_9MICC
MVPAPDRREEARIAPRHGGWQFALIWVAQLIAKTGNGLTPFALTIYAYQQTGLSTSVALVTLVGFLPAVVLAPFAGVLADRFDRKKLMALSNALSAASLAFVLVTLHFSGGNLPLICLCLVLSSVSASVLDPAYRAIVTDLLSPAQYARAGGFVQLASAAQLVVSPALAGLLMARFDVTNVVAVDLALTAVATALMLLIRGAGQPHRTAAVPGVWTDLRAGLRFLSENRGITVLVLLVTLITFCMGFLQTLLTPMMLDLTSEETLGVVRSIAAVGIVIASLAIGIIGMGSHHLRSMSAFLAVGGIVVALMGATTNVFLIGTFAFVFFLTLPPLNTSMEVLARSAIPNNIQGRVWGLIGFISQLGYVVAYALSGVLADTVFNPLLVPDGPLASSIGQIIGTGPSRGIGLLFGVVGLLLVVLALVIPRARSVRSIESELRRAVQDSAGADSSSAGNAGQYSPAQETGGRL